MKFEAGNYYWYYCPFCDGYCYPYFDFGSGILDFGLVEV
jgi:hypothetical protein